MRKAREQVKYMVTAGISSRKIRNYLHHWSQWWTNTSTTWHYQVLLQQFIEVCKNQRVAMYAAALQQLHFNKLMPDFDPALHTRPMALADVAA